MAGKSISEALAGLTAEDINVDEEGRVEINNPEISKTLAEAVSEAPGKGGQTPSNASACQPNGSKCSPNASQCNPPKPIKA
ncbi:hypothetical protein PS467_40335 [Streptomyces luomodiensis]|uniref:Uncharacterized protein n=1 Tax=Streptomyces luomodiensis TaxID=3026192 RepID=A0ABY9V8Q2_9ACTN|nr:hypothetical protein [Streptomyces sp. SCA4-21]WNF01154.1 hypothetical protein PS467_40335 [Streptomyces sp. SCA4-21]